MEKKCPVCGAAMEEDMCSYCGYREKENIQESVCSEKSPENEITYGISQKILTPIKLGRINKMPFMARFLFTW